MGQLEEQPWPTGWSTQIGARIRTLRDAAGMSAQKVSERCTELGFPIPRSTIANIESGRKEAIPVHEVSVIAAALNVPPAALLFPVEQQGEVEVLPGVFKQPFAAWTWFTDASIGFNILEHSQWNSSPAYTDFLEVLQANVALRRHEANWQIMQGVIRKMEDLSDDDEMVRAIKATRSRQQAEARDASRYLQLLDSKDLPIPDLPEKFEEDIRAVLGGGQDA